jgi:DNA-binding response OmpR family regulator
MPSNVLIIAEDSATIEFLTSLIKEQKFEVLTAYSARQGIKIARENFLDLIILDWSAVGADGRDFFAAIRRFSYIPVLVISAFDQPGVIARVLDSGADDYLVKPVPGAVFLAHMNKMIRWTETNGWKYISPQAAHQAI